MLQNKNIIIFASGAGSNAKNIIEYFKNTHVHIVGIFTNNPTAGVIQIAHNNNIPVHVISKKILHDTNFSLQTYIPETVDLIVLAGFLLLFPVHLITQYKNKIINIHPSLLPKYGGKGMHGMHVHEAVIENKESQSGITIHFVNEEYDKGKIIVQATCPVISSDTAETVAKKIHELEFENFPKTIENILLNQ